MSADTNSDKVIKDLLITVKMKKRLGLCKIKVLGKFSMDDIAKIAELYLRKTKKQSPLDY